MIIGERELSEEEIFSFGRLIKAPHCANNVQVLCELRLYLSTSPGGIKQLLDSVIR